MDYEQNKSGGYGKRPLWQWVVLYVVLGLIVYAVIYFLFFRGSYSTPKSSNSSNTSTSQTTGNTGSQSTSNSVTIQNLAFNPSDITVKKGTTVTWTNQDSTGHTVTETDGKTGPQSSTLANGGTYSFTYNETGTFQYHCSIHSSMTGTVTVTQ